MEMIRYNSGLYTDVLKFLRDECIIKGHKYVYQMFEFDELVNRMELYNTRAVNKGSLLAHTFVGYDSDKEICAVAYFNRTYTIVVKDSDLSLFIEMCEFIMDYFKSLDNDYCELSICGLDTNFLGYALERGFQSSPVTTKIYSRYNENIKTSLPILSPYSFNVKDSYDSAELALFIKRTYFTFHSRMSESGIMYSLLNAEKSMFVKDSFVVEVRDGDVLIATTYCIVDKITGCAYITPILIGSDLYGKGVEELIVRKALDHIKDERSDITSVHATIKSIYDHRCFLRNAFGYKNSIWTYSIK